MKCAVGLCGHCQLGADCSSAATARSSRYDRVEPLLRVREL